MNEWIVNGCQLAWLIDPIERKIVVYRSNTDPEIKDFSFVLTGEEILPGFLLNPLDIFDKEL
jgi:Uma2 family endonuclease